MRRFAISVLTFSLLVSGVALAPGARADSAGITWTSRTSAADNAWNSVTYGNGLFVAVSTTGTGNRVMTSGVFGGGNDSAAPAPPPVIQQFGRPASGTCDAAAPVTLNWGGAGSGGWGESWAQWMNGGNGGAVCTRMLVYSSSRGAWAIG